MANTVQRFTFAQLEALWINNGGSRALAPTMAAIALAESSGIPSRTNPKDNGGRQTSWGLWQVSDGTHNMPQANILDPNVNAKAAVAKYKSQGLKAWGTYTSGAYREFLKNGVDPNGTGLPSGSTSTANADQAGLTGDIGGAIGEGFANAFKAVLQPLISTFLWGGEILFGIALMVGGVVVFVLNTDTGKSAAVGTGKLALDAASVAQPEAAPELQTVKGGVSGQRAALRARAARTASQTKATREAKAKKAAESGDTSNTDLKTGNKHKVKSA
jgi:hypothetical protein